MGHREVGTEARYRFRAVTRDDFPVLRDWLSQPHLEAFWGPPEREIALIEADLDNPDFHMHIVELEDRAFAYVQDYPIEQFPAKHFAPLLESARGAIRAMDTFIGCPEFLGRGHGSAYVRQRSDQILTAIVEGAANGAADTVVVDPVLTNHRAIRAYARAGFSKNAVTAGDNGQMVQLMSTQAA